MLQFNNHPAKQDFKRGFQYEVPEWLRALVSAESGLILPAVITCFDAGDQRDFRLVHEPELFHGPDGPEWVMPGEVLPVEKTPPCFAFRAGWRIQKFRVDLPATLEDPELRKEVSAWVARQKKAETAKSSKPAQRRAERGPTAKEAKVSQLLAELGDII